MQIDWAIVSRIAAPIIALFVGVWVNRRFESRPHLISYFGHVASFRVTVPGTTNKAFVNTHSVVLRNVGRRSAKNVRLRHNKLPDFNVWPELQHRVEDLPNGSKEIVIPTLVPKEEVTISYLYLPPTTVAEINAGIRSDEGFAQAIPVLMQRQYPRWWNYSVVTLMLVGLVTAVYLIIDGVAWTLRHLH